MKKVRILICGILPPPYFGHSMTYKVLMESPFVHAYDVVFFNIKFWSYQKHKKITAKKLFQLMYYYFKYIFLILTRRPRYVLYGISFDKMPLVKDFLFCITGRALGCRIILHDMGQYLRELYAVSGPFYQWVIRRLMSVVTASIILGEKTRSVYAGLLEAKRVIVVAGAVSDTRVIASNAPKTTASHGAVHVLYFSFLSVSKGIWTALKAIPRIVSKNPNVRFTLAGPVESDDLLDQINKFISEHDMGSHVKYIGYVGDDDARVKCFREADIFMFPTHRDVFGLVLLHAMAEGVAVVASREGSIPEIIEDGENGFLFPKGDETQLADRILSLAGNPGLRQAMGQKNREKFLRMYTPERLGQRMIQAFDEILLME